MSLFRRTQPKIFGVVDVGSTSIKAILFEVSRDGPAADGAHARQLVPLPALPHTQPHDTSGTVYQRYLASTTGNIGSATPQLRERDTAVRPIEKFTWDLPESYSGVRLARKIREGVFRMIQRLQELPTQIIVAVGPMMGEMALRTWRMAPGPGGRMLTRRDIRAYYRELFAKETDLRRAVIAAPVEVLINGYPLALRSRGAGDDILPRGRAEEIVFRTLSLYMPVESGAALAEIKNTLGGVPIEFIPLPVVYTEAVVQGLNVADCLLIDVGGNDTSILSIRDRRFSHAGFIPLGTRRLAEYLARNKDLTVREAEKAMRLPVGVLSKGESPAAGGLRLARQSDNALSGAIRQWKQSIATALDAFAYAGPVSPDIMLTGGGAHIAELRAAVQAGGWLGNASYGDVPRLRILEGHTFFSGDTLGGYLQGPEDAGLGALAVYAASREPVF